MIRLLLALMLWLAAAPVALADTGWKLVATYPHDPAAFTQGLIFHDGHLYESTGQYGQSQIRRVSPHDGRVLRSASLPSRYFGEGMTLWKDRLVSLTWRGGTGFLWSLDAFRPLGSFGYAGEGWGLTQDGRRLILSDGSSMLRFLDPDSFAETGRVEVRWNGRPVRLLNELEYVDGEVLANIWMTDRIARIDPATGEVKSWIDLSQLARRVMARDPDAVLNGIAHDPATGRLYITGKLWPKMFVIKLRK